MHALRCLCLCVLLSRADCRVLPSARRRGQRPYSPLLLRHRSGPHVCHSGGSTVCCPGWAPSTVSGLCVKPVCALGCGSGLCVAPNVCLCHGGKKELTCEGEGLAGDFMSDDLADSSQEGSHTSCLSAGCEHSCVLIGGFPICSCSHGYSLAKDGRSCQDVDECSRFGGASLCQQVCRNTMGSFRCHCYHGYQLSANGRSCVTVAVTTSQEGCGQYGCELKCNEGGCELVSRVCPVGFSMTETASGVTCTDIDECSESWSPCQQQCLNTAGSYQCSCRPGFYLHRNGRTCRDVDECSSPTRCHQRCINTVGSFHCACRRGYRYSTQRHTCTDIDECQRLPPPCQHQCLNVIGSFRCSCAEGFRLLSGGLHCEDVDECTLIQNSLCDHICINTPGSFHCSCYEGYILSEDTKSCTGLPDPVGSTTIQEIPRLLLKKIGTSAPESTEPLLKYSTSTFPATKPSSLISYSAPSSVQTMTSNLTFSQYQPSVKTFKDIPNTKHVHLIDFTPEMTLTTLQSFSVSTDGKSLPHSTASPTSEAYANSKSLLQTHPLLLLYSYIASIFPPISNNHHRALHSSEASDNILPTLHTLPKFFSFPEVPPVTSTYVVSAVPSTLQVTPVPSFTLYTPTPLSPIVTPKSCTHHEDTVNPVIPPMTSPLSQPSLLAFVPSHILSRVPSHSQITSVSPLFMMTTSASPVFNLPPPNVPLKRFTPDFQLYPTSCPLYIYKEDINAFTHLSYTPLKESISAPSNFLPHTEKNLAQTLLNGLDLSDPHSTHFSSPEDFNAMHPTPPLTSHDFLTQSHTTFALLSKWLQSAWSVSTILSIQPYPATAVPVTTQTLSSFTLRTEAQQLTPSTSTTQCSYSQSSSLHSFVSIPLQPSSQNSIPFIGGDYDAEPHIHPYAATGEQLMRAAPLDPPPTDVAAPALTPSSTGAPLTPPLPSLSLSPALTTPLGSGIAPLPAPLPILTAVLCLHQGTQYSEGSSWLDADCNNCTCLKGSVICHDVTCTVSCTHPAWDPDQCCPTCKRCLYQGLVLEDEHTFSPENDSCTLCLCLAGNVTCLSPVCPPVSCAQPVLSDCCPLCPVQCMYLGQEYPEGSEFSSPGDSCATCVCLNGQVDCFYPPCPTLDCPLEDWLREGGNCCPTCAQTQKREGCSVDDNGLEFPVGQIWSPGDPCETCVCQAAGKVVCHWTECIESCSHPIRVPGQCCPDCSMGCSYRGLVYEINESFLSQSNPCLTCICLAGSVACSPVHCQPNCTYPFHQEGQCCPLCQDCNYEGRKVGNGQTFSLENQPCVHCICQFGEVTCEEVSCTVTCSHPYPLLGECCPTCTVCLYEGQVLEDGGYYISETEPCTVCLCAAGSVSCEWRGGSCPDLPCAGPLLHIPGQCCPICPGQLFAENKYSTDMTQDFVFPTSSTQPKISTSHKLLCLPGISGTPVDDTLTGHTDLGSTATPTGYSTVQLVFHTVSNSHPVHNASPSSTVCFTIQSLPPTLDSPSLQATPLLPSSTTSVETGPAVRQTVQKSASSEGAAIKGKALQEQILD
ncbi:von Willebrand factor C and EGF domain-containing protein isoform X1 [Lepisosteus oculatus]|uniref:von Willebrand factor C and EGF domain-containing protein isoform X1 n=1 Tax=Lepisosteus oculatus TaxID=7918 RepID=UPI0035F50E8C